MTSFFSCIIALIMMLLVPCASWADSVFHLEPFKVLHGGEIYSPKSAAFSKDGRKLYVNALEGQKTLVFDTENFELIKVIEHSFAEEESALFLNGENSLFDYSYNTCHGNGEKNIFSGKPVEMTFTHDGAYLWVTYYRRVCDSNASSPSALAIIDTKEDRIVRVMPTAPLPKMIVASPEAKRVAVTHWGDNTVGLISIENDDPFSFAYEKLVVVGKRLNVKNIRGNRDAVCGQCLRGSVFTKDGRYLFVAGMRTQKLAVIEVSSGTVVGSVTLPVANPRHFVLNNEGTKLYVTFNKPGKIAELDVDDIIAKAKQNGVCKGRVLEVGSGARTCTLSQDNKRLYVACNSSSQLVCVDIESWKVIDSIAVAPYAVGLAVHPEETFAVVTSQGKKGHGGNAVSIYRIIRDLQAPTEKPEKFSEEFSDNPNE